jgi:DNA-binding beta-propeller fold protein YncE
MILRTSVAAGLFIAASLHPAWSGRTVSGVTAAARAGFEVWIADQSDTRAGFGGQLLVYEGDHLMGASAAQATPIARLDLGAETADLCRAATGRNPVRPHMILFNNGHTHAILSFVASGHVVIMDAATRRPLSCFETTIGSTKTRQAHAAYPAPDGSYILVANQNGKRLERIDTNFATNTFTHNAAATLDLMTCTTPNGQPCEHPDLRPINWPICPIVDSTSRYGFVTLRGGGLFVVDARATPMAILGEYDKAAVRGNGCGGIEVAGSMYINSGGSPVNVSGTDPHHPALYGFDVYRFPLSGYTTFNQPNTPAPALLLTKSGMSDSHGVAATNQDRYLWAMDRHANVAEIIEVASGKWVNTVNLAGEISDDPAPDLVDTAPAGNRLFVALRGSVPLSGDPHNARGTTPGLGIIQVTQGGRSGRLFARVPLTNPNQQPGQAPDAHGLRVRLK